MWKFLPEIASVRPLNALTIEFIGVFGSYSTNTWTWSRRSAPIRNSQFAIRNWTPRLKPGAWIMTDVFMSRTACLDINFSVFSMAKASVLYLFNCELRIANCELLSVRSYLQALYNPSLLCCHRASVFGSTWVSHLPRVPSFDVWVSNGDEPLQIPQSGCCVDTASMSTFLVYRPRLLTARLIYCSVYRNERLTGNGGLSWLGVRLIPSSQKFHWLWTACRMQSCCPALKQVDSNTQCLLKWSDGADEPGS